MGDITPNQKERIVTLLNRIGKPYDIEVINQLTFGDAGYLIRKLDKEIWKQANKLQCQRRWIQYT